MGNSSSSAVRLAYALRFALVVLVSLAFGLVLGYSTAPALKWLGKRIAAAEPSQPVSLDSYASRRTEPVISAKADSDSPFGRLPLMLLVGRVNADKRFDVNANAVPRQASVDWPLTASPKAVSATSDEGYLFSPTLRAGPNVQDSRSGRPVQTDDLRALSSVRTVTHPGEHRESKPHWDYCGNPQCRLCYPVDQPVMPALASDTGLPDMPQGYCKRHPQSRDCKPIVVPPSPKPLPKATDPPVVASAGLGVVSRETLAWVLVCVFFVAWLVSGFEIHRLRRRQTVSDFRDTVETAGLARVRRLVQDWLDKQGHDRCWYYPEIFEQLARALELQHIVLKPPQLPTLDEFRAGCERFQREEYPEKPIGVLMHDSGDSRRGTPASLTHDGQVVFVRRRPELRDIKLNISFDKPKAQEPSEGKHLPVARPIRVSAGHIPESARCDAGDLCTLHKPCAKHGGKPGQPIGDVEAETRLQSNNSDERGTDST